MQLWAEVRYVQIARARLLKRPSAFSPTVKTLAYRTAVTVVSRRGAFYLVTGKRRHGYIAASSLAAHRPKFASKIAGTYVSSNEVATATKGFNAQVEAQYRQQNANLPYAYLNQLEKATHYPNPQAAFGEFRKQGKLGEFQAGGDGQ